jgi:hypothetical protein
LCSTAALSISGDLWEACPPRIRTIGSSGFSRWAIACGIKVFVNYLKYVSLSVHPFAVVAILMIDINFSDLILPNSSPDLRVHIDPMFFEG